MIRRPVSSLSRCYRIKEQHYADSQNECQRISLRFKDIVASEWIARSSAVMDVCEKDGPLSVLSQKNALKSSGGRIGNRDLNT